MRWCGRRELRREGGPTWGIFRRHTTRIARALVDGAEKAKQRKLGRVRIFTDAQAVITRVMRVESGTGQTYALQVRKAIAALRERKPTVEVEIRRCPRAQRDLRERGRGQVGQTGHKRTGRSRC